VEYIDWAATDDQGRIALKTQVSELLTPVRIAHPEGESSGSDSEDSEMKGDTPDTTPPSSPPIGPADVSSPIASLHKHADKLIQSKAKLHPIPDEEILDLIVNSLTIDTEDEDRVENFKRALAKSRIRMSTSPAIPAPAKSRLPPATPPSRSAMANGLVTPPRTLSPQSVLQAGAPDFVPTSHPSSPHSPFANVSFQYPHFVVTETTHGVAHSPLGSKDDGPQQDVDMRA
jgi:hypothetical protein